MENIEKSERERDRVGKVSKTFFSYFMVQTKFAIKKLRSCPAMIFFLNKKYMSIDKKILSLCTHSHEQALSREIHLKKYI